MNTKHHRITVLVIFLAASSALLASQAVAFSPGSSSLKTDAPTRLGYRNYDDIAMIDASNTEPASLPPRGVATITSKIKQQGSKSVTQPKLHDEATFTTLDVDADRTPLSILLEPPAVPLTAQQQTNTLPSRQSLRVTSTASRAATRSSPITELVNIQDYYRHVLSEPDKLCIIRFHAPLCQTCRTTNVSWERMASKIDKMNASKRKVKFLSVNVDGNNEDVAKLKDMLRIKSVPQGVIHYASEGLFGQKIHLNRKNLGNLKKQLENYLTNDMGADMFLYGLKREM